MVTLYYTVSVGAIYLIKSYLYQNPDFMLKVEEALWEE